MKFGSQLGGTVHHGVGGNHSSKGVKAAVCIVASQETERGEWRSLDHFLVFISSQNPHHEMVHMHGESSLLGRIQRYVSMAILNLVRLILKILKTDHYTC